MIINFNKLHLQAGFTTWFEQETSLIKEKLDKYVKLNKIIISDCDGIITDGKSICGCDGKKYKIYGSYDKEIMMYLHGFGWKFFFVSDDGEGMLITKTRLDHLNKHIDILEYGKFGWKDRLQLVQDFLDKGYIVGFIGDSLSDIASLNIATFAGTTANAPAEVKKYCDFISELNGASGGFADLIYNMHIKVINQL